MSAAPAASDAFALEERLETAGRELLRQLLQDHLDLRARQEEDLVRAGARPVVVGPEGQVRPWRENGHARWLASVFGLVRVTRVAHRGPGACNVHPTDAALSLSAGRHSMGLRRLAVTEALTGHLDQLRYDTALANGWPIATGAIEGACRHLIADRLDITGARWGLPGAEAVLRLRTVVANGDLDVYWRFHTAREHERLYPTPEQQNYTLTV